MLEVGTEIYNGGDMSNSPHFGKIVKVQEAGKYSPLQYKIKTEEREYWIPAHMFSEVYKGHGGTRFVTREAYLKWCEESLKVLEERFKNLK